jgi:hypothetical protein
VKRKELGLLGLMAGLFIGLAAFTGSPTSVSADVESIDMPEGLSHGVETCSGIPGTGPCEVIRVKAQEDDGNLFIKVDRGTLSRVVEASVSTPFGPQDCPFDGEGTSSITIHTDACDSNSVTSDNLVVLLSLIPTCPKGEDVAVGAQVLGQSGTLKDDFALCGAPDKGELKVLKDCLIPGPGGKVVFPPPPEGSFEMTLYRGKSTLHDLGIEEVIAVFTLACGQTKTFQLEPGTYNVFEFDPDPKSGFGQIANFCINVAIAPGAKVACNLTNDKFPPPPIVIRPPSTGDAGLVKPSSEANTSLRLAATATALVLAFTALRFAQR